MGVTVSFSLSSMEFRVAILEMIEWVFQDMADFESIFDSICETFSATGRPMDDL